MPRRLLALLLLVLPAFGDEPATPSIAIGTVVDHVELIDVRYRVPRGLGDLLRGEPAPKAVALAFTTLDCPLAGRYLPRLAALEAAFRERGVRLALVNAGPKDGMTAIAARALEAGFDGPVLKDHDGAAARALGVDKTPQVVVLDPVRAIRYRGRVDDMHRLGGSRPEPTREDLRLALEDLLAGRPVAVPETAVDGCRLAGPPAREGAVPTFAQVAPILQKNCQGCHRPGGMGPFELVEHADIASWSQSIAEVVRDERMPPWYASPGTGAFANHAGLAPEEKEALLAWIAAGAPKGTEPPPPAPAHPSPTGWLIEEPDLVIQTDAPAIIPAEGLVPYRYEILSHKFEQDTWIDQLQIRAENPRVMHHCNLIYLLPDDPRKPHFITGQVPGGVPLWVRNGLAVKIPAGATLVLQVHYVTTGQKEQDRIAVGMRWPRGKVEKEVRHVMLDQHGLAIPPGAPGHEVRASKTLDHDVTGLALFEHMHVRGRDATFLAHTPDGASRPLLVIPAYSFDWQLSYLLEPGSVRLPKGTRIECVGHYDNSTWNPYNPDPKATVRWGEQTHEEMFVGFFFFTRDAERLDLRIDPLTGHARRWW